MGGRHLALIAVLVGVIGGSAFAQQAAPPASPASPTAKPAQARPKADEKAKCFRETYVGTVIGERVCRTASEREADMKVTSAVVDANKEAVQQFTSQLLTVPAYDALGTK